MLAILQQSASALQPAALAQTPHLLCLLPKAPRFQLPDDLPGRPTLEAILARRGLKPQDLSGKPVAGTLPDGAFAVWAMLDLDKPAFEQQETLRKALAPLLAEQQGEIALSVHGAAPQRAQLAALSVYCAWVNGALLPVRKQKDERRALARIRLYGHRAADGFARERARAEGNFLVRELTWLPPNELTPALYRKRIRRLAQAEGWEFEDYGLKRLRKMGAGAFVAVAQGSADDDAVIVRLRRRAPGAKKTVALVGKGICFDTGGHNLKPARYMHGMHEDMNGSAVCLGILLAAARARLRVNLEAWLALAQNHISPRAYKQNEVVSALDGTTIEVVHTDAEGRMVLADALALAARGKPDLMVDFATLTGSMHVALGSRYSGVFANRPALLERALAAGQASGERACAFPQDADYDGALESQIADVKQCSMEAEADHILATRFLSRFVAGRPWVHVDLAASSCKGGLGAVATDLTGWGVGWGLELLAGLGKAGGRKAAR